MARTCAEIDADRRSINVSLVDIFPDGNVNGATDEQKSRFDALNVQIKALDEEYDAAAAAANAERDARELNAERQKRLDALKSRMEEEAKERGEKPRTAELPPGIAAGEVEREDSPLVDQFWNGRMTMDARGRITRSEENKSFLRYLQTGDETGLRSDKDGRVITRANVVVGTPSAGGLWVPDDNRYANMVIETMKAYAGVEQVAFVFSTPGGSDLPIPTVNDTANVAVGVAEATAAAEAALTVGRLVLGAYKVTSGALPVSTEMTEDSGPAIEAIIGRLLGIRMGRKVAADYANGAGGSNAPNGILTAAAKGGDLARSGGTISDMHLAGGVIARAVDIAYRNMPNAAFVTSDDLLNAFRTAIGTANGNFLYPQLAFSDGPDAVRRFQGMRVVIEPNYPAFPAGSGTTKAATVGDHMAYFIRKVRGLRMTRNPYVKSDEDMITFQTWLRHDADLTDTEAVKHILVTSS